MDLDLSGSFEDVNRSGHFLRKKYFFLFFNPIFFYRMDLNEDRDSFFRFFSSLEEKLALL